MVQGPTPDVVLAGVEVLAYGIDEERPGIGDVAVVDVGGATTDVYSVVTLDPDGPTTGSPTRSSRRRSATRTVEADLGMRESAVATAAGRPRRSRAEPPTRDPYCRPTRSTR